MAVEWRKAVTTDSKSSGAVFVVRHPASSYLPRVPGAPLRHTRASAFTGNGDSEIRRQHLLLKEGRDHGSPSRNNR
jgi:hypothetical protein